jgi:Fur family peroxide stress response transcriptional regulator
MKEHKNSYGGIKMTPQRIAILQYLEDNKMHPSAADIFRSVSERFPTMSFATVYNTLDTLKTLRMVRELTIDPEKKRFDPNMKPHGHLICVDCHKIVDVVRGFPVELDETERCGFKILGNHVDFYGLCPECGQGSEDKRPTQSKLE